MNAGYCRWACSSSLSRGDTHGCWQSRRLRAKLQVDLLSLTTWQLVIGTVPLILLAVMIPEQPNDWSAAYIGMLAFMSVISTALCWWLWITLPDRAPAWEASLSVLGTPVVAIVSSRLMLGEDFKLGEVTGILLIALGLALLSLIGWAASRRRTIKWSCYRVKN